MCLSQGMANWIDPGGMIASKAMQQVAGDSPVGTALQGISGFGGTVKAYNKFLVPKDPVPPAPVNTSGSLSISQTPSPSPAPVQATSAPKQSPSYLNTNLSIPQYPLAPQPTTPGLNIPA